VGVRETAGAVRLLTDLVYGLAGWGWGVSESVGNWQGGREVSNFGGNVRFRPGRLAVPRSESEVCRLVQEHRGDGVRVVGSRHAWSPLIRTSGLLLDLRYLDVCRLYEDGDRLLVAVGGGCQIWKLLAYLNERDLTLPSVGLITEQTVAGAISTATHGSGRHSLSHYVQRIRLVHFDASGGGVEARWIEGGEELQAARCGLGAMGVITEVVFSVVPQYRVQEQMVVARSLSDVLSMEAETPLQQFFLIPHLWQFYVQRRRETLDPGGRLTDQLYRVYWFLAMDLGLHLVVLLTAVFLRSRGLVRLFFSKLLPWTVVTSWRPTDRSDRQLVMEHELFRHVEEELFVRRADLGPALALVEDLLRLGDDRAWRLSGETCDQLRRVGLLGEVSEIEGCWTHHYPICVRRVRADATLISMSAGGTEDWYAISLINYQRGSEDFYRFAGFVGAALIRIYGARPHWGKWFPEAELRAELYPELGKFIEQVKRCDPGGVFRRGFVSQLPGMSE